MSENFDYHYHKDEPMGWEESEEENWGEGFFQRLEEEEIVYKVKKKKLKLIGDYAMGDLLGEGSYGKVKELLHTQTLHRYAVKILKSRKLRRIPNGESNVAHEIKLLKRLNHPNVIKLIEVLYNEEKQKMYIVLEYCVAGLQDLLLCSEKKKFPMRQAHCYFRQLVEGLGYLHARGVIHKDIKPGNLLVDRGEGVKITDFGVAEFLEVFREDDICTVSQGSPVFQPPEVANGESFSGSKLDVWSSGVTLYNITTGKYPFDGDTIFLLFENISKGEFEIPEEVDESLASLIRGMLNVDERMRFSLEDVRMHRWFRTPPPSHPKESFVTIPGERRKISVLPYIVGEYGCIGEYGEEMVLKSRNKNWCGIS